MPTKAFSNTNAEILRITRSFPQVNIFFLLPDLTLLRPTLEYCRQWQFWFMLQGSIQGYQRSGKSVSCEAV